MKIGICTAGFGPWATGDFIRRSAIAAEEAGFASFWVGDHVLLPELMYFHKWQADDMVLWDNWRMLHRVIGCTPPQRRVMQRTTIRGDCGLGRFENDDQGRYRELERTV